MEIQEAIELLESVGYDVIPPKQNVCDTMFEHWWNLYNKKRGKEKCLKKWGKMSLRERKWCIDATPAYVESCKQLGKQYQKDPLTYLNNKSWNDEIIYKDEKQHLYNKAANIINSD